MSKHLNAGDTFRRKRGFRRPPEGYSQAWWTPNSLDPATHEGFEYLEIVEIVITATFGRVTIYREWWLDPDGNVVAVTKDWIPDPRKAAIRAERSLLRSIACEKMEAVGRVAKETVEKKKDVGLYDGLDLGSMRTMGSA
jgi:hypothetical protein